MEGTGRVGRERHLIPYYQNNDIILNLISYNNIYRRADMQRGSSSELDMTNAAFRVFFFFFF